MNITLTSIITFLSLAKRDGWSFDFILTQLRLVNQGVRDARLHDNCMVLLDGISDAKYGE